MCMNDLIVNELKKINELQTQAKKEYEWLILVVLAMMLILITVYSTQLRYSSLLMFFVGILALIFLFRILIPKKESKIYTKLQKDIQNLKDN